MVLNPVMLVIRCSMSRLSVHSVAYLLVRRLSLRHAVHPTPSDVPKTRVSFSLLCAYIFVRLVNLIRSKKSAGEGLEDCIGSVVN